MSKTNKPATKTTANKLPPVPQYVDENLKPIKLLDKAATPAKDAVKPAETKSKPVSRAKTPRDQSKAAVARQVFADYVATHEQIVRKDVVMLLIEKAGLTLAGASTYFYNLLNESGLSTQRQTKL